METPSGHEYADDSSHYATGASNIRDALADALSDYLTIETLNAGKETFDTVHSTVKENGHVALYVTIIFLVLFAVIGFGCMWCWLMKRAFRGLIILFFIMIGGLLIIDISLHLSSGGEE